MLAVWPWRVTMTDPSYVSTLKLLIRGTPRASPWARGPESVMRRPVSSERAVIVGFVGLLSLMAILAVDSALQAHDLSMQSGALRQASRVRDALLDQLRTETYRSATLVRDYLLEEDEKRAGHQKSELLGVRAHLSDVLNRYSAVAPPAEVDAVRILKQQTDAYWLTLTPAFGWDGSSRREKGELLIRTVLVPRRDELVQLVGRISALDEQTLDAAEERIQVVQNRFRTRVGEISVLALVLGCVLAIVVVRRVRRLAERADQQFSQVCEAREDLKRLSDRLVSVQEEERRSLSRELHDDLGQTMSAMLFELGKAETKCARRECERDDLLAVRRLAEENIAKVRNMALLLRPAMLDELGLVPALHWHVREVARRTGLKVRLIADELNDDLPEANRVCIYRLVQEALNNCVKHSKAGQVRVVVRRDPDGLSIFVQDDGIGFDAGHDKGLGLLGLMERVIGLGGRFHVESQPGQGSVVSAYFPLENGQYRPEQEEVV